MELNIENAIKYMFKDKEWKKKFLIGSLFMVGMVIMNVISELSRMLSDVKPEQIKPYMEMIPAILIVTVFLFVIGSILNIFVTGYFAKNINLRIFKPNSNLLEWRNWGNMFFVGVKATAAILIYFLIFGLLLLLPLIVIIGLIATKEKILILLVSLFTIGVIFLASIIFAFFLGAASLAFNTDLKFSSYFNFKLIKKFITKNFFQFFIYIILVTAIAIAVNIINSILMLTVVGIILMPVILFYQFMVQNDLAAQFVRQTLELPQEEIE